MTYTITFQIESNETPEHVHEWIENELGMKLTNMIDNPLEFACIEALPDSLKIHHTLTATESDSFTTQ